MLENGTMTLGVNYWASHAATQMWSRWDAEEIEKDFKLLAEHGVSILRVFPTWNDFQPICAIHHAGRAEMDSYETRMFETEEHCPDTPAGYAGVDERMMERFELFCNLAEKYGFKLIVCVLTGHMTSRLFIPRALERLNLYSDPIALKWEARYIDYFVRRMKHHPAIWAWESGNETNCLGKIQNHEQAEVWLRYIHSVFRLADSSRPVIGICGLNITAAESPWVSRINADLSDYVTVHPYNMWSKAGIEEFNGIRNLFYCAAQCSALEQISGAPAFVEETGLWRPMAVSLEGLAAYQRGLLWNLWSANCRAMLWWCAFDQELFDTAPYDWAWPGLEHGLFRSDRTPQPGAKVIAGFGKFVRSMEFGALPPAKTDLLILAADHDLVHSSYILARQAGLIPAYQSPEDPLRDSPVYLLPSAKARGLLTTRRWEALLEKIRAGATLLLVWNDTYLSHLNEVCGAEVVFRRERSGTEQYAFDGFSLTLPRPVQVVFRSRGAEVLAHDSEGNPCFFRNRYGKGTVYTLGFPLEHLLYTTAGLYGSDAWKIYAEVCPKELPLSVESPFVTQSLHEFGDGRAALLLVNNGMDAFTGKAEFRKGWTFLSAHTDSPKAASYENGILSLDGNAGILLMAEKEK